MKIERLLGTFSIQNLHITWMPVWLSFSSSKVRLSRVKFSFLLTSSSISSSSSSSSNMIICKIGKTSTEQRITSRCRYDLATRLSAKLERKKLPTSTEQRITPQSRYDIESHPQPWIFLHVFTILYKRKDMTVNTLVSSITIIIQILPWKRKYSWYDRLIYMMYTFSYNL